MYEIITYQNRTIHGMAAWKCSNCSSKTRKDANLEAIPRKKPHLGTNRMKKTKEIVEIS